MQKAFECIKAFRTTGTKTDVQGWYTGLYKDYKDTRRIENPNTVNKTVFLDNTIPVQDADDL